jgi:hypothetical protein
MTFGIEMLLIDLASRYPCHNPASFGKLSDRMIFLFNSFRGVDDDGITQCFSSSVIVLLNDVGFPGIGPCHDPASIRKPRNGGVDRVTPICCINDLIFFENRSAIRIITLLIQIFGTKLAYPRHNPATIRERCDGGVKSDITIVCGVDKDFDANLATILIIPLLVSISARAAKLRPSLPGHYPTTVGKSRDGRMAYIPITGADRLRDTLRTTISVEALHIDCALIATSSRVMIVSMPGHHPATVRNAGYRQIKYIVPNWQLD